MEFQESPIGQLLLSVHEEWKETTSMLHKTRRRIIIEYDEVKAKNHPMEIYIPSTSMEHPRGAKATARMLIKGSP